MCKIIGIGIDSAVTALKLRCFVWIFMLMYQSKMFYHLSFFFAFLTLGLDSNAMFKTVKYFCIYLSIISS